MAEERSRKQPEVNLHIEAVPYRSAAWCELWRQIFIAIAEELDRLDLEEQERVPSRVQDPER